MPRNFSQVIGVDFSGAAKAGDNIWLAFCDVRSRCLSLRELRRLSDIAGTPDRDPALRFLVNQIAWSRDALWGIDFPFSLPVDLHEMGKNWRAQLRFLQKWSGNAVDFGHWCLDHAKRLNREMHIRRATDKLASTPFDCYHYRIIYQTFHGMRDVLTPLLKHDRVAVGPFQIDQIESASVVVVETCPGSTLRRLKLPYNNYKQPTGGPLTSKRRRTRRAIVDAMRKHVVLRDEHIRTIMRNPGGDALDAVIAAVGTHQSWNVTSATPLDSCYCREGFIYA
jgi:Protein of unknown function (DUF429)